MNDELLSVETISSHADVPAMGRTIADGIDGDKTLHVALEDQSVSVPLPESASFEFEIELKWNESTAHEERTDLRRGDGRSHGSESDETPTREAKIESGDNRSRPTPSDTDCCNDLPAQSQDGRGCIGNA